MHMSSHYLPRFIVAFFLLLSSYASAQSVTEEGADAEFASDEVFELTDFVVSDADDEGYYSANSTSVTRTDALVKNTPISLSIVNQQLIEDLNLVSTEDLALVNASIDEDPNGFSLDRIRIRGFRSAFPRYNFFRRNLPNDSYNVSRVDVIKGANSLIFGQASPGGTVNLGSPDRQLQEEYAIYHLRGGQQGLPTHRHQRQSNHQRQARRAAHGCAEQAGLRPSAQIQHTGCGHARGHLQAQPSNAGAPPSRRR